MIWYAVGLYNYAVRVLACFIWFDLIRFVLLCILHWYDSSVSFHLFFLISCLLCLHRKEQPWWWTWPNWRMMWRTGRWQCSGRWPSYDGSNSSHISRGSHDTTGSWRLWATLLFWREPNFQLPISAVSTDLWDAHLIFVDLQSTERGGVAGRWWVVGSDSYVRSWWFRVWMLAR